MAGNDRETHARLIKDLSPRTKTLAVATLAVLFVLLFWATLPDYDPGKDWPKWGGLLLLGASGYGSAVVGGYRLEKEHLETGGPWYSAEAVMAAATGAIACIAMTGWALYTLGYAGVIILGLAVAAFCTGVLAYRDHSRRGVGQSGG